MEVKLRERYIPAFIMLVAGAITSIINIINKVDKITGLKRLLIVIIVFYMIGTLAKAIIKRAFKNMSKQEETQDNQEEEIPPEEDNK
jgi:hypothetical protein